MSRLPDAPLAIATGGDPNLIYLATVSSGLYRSIDGGDTWHGGRVLEITSLIAMFVYALIAWAIIRLVWLLFYQPSARNVTTHEVDQSPRVD